jgi:hypothetical protein
LVLRLDVVGFSGKTHDFESDRSPMSPHEYEGQGEFLLDVMILEKVTLVERDALGEDLEGLKMTWRADS